ncbi:MAG: lipid A biosynthesis lauroyl acyltransferase [Hyphococcus sp.]|nr:MAG: lipid A biosynthesis lauroyl acyltransferase [Marinicaulis sp.]
MIDDHYELPERRKDLPLKFSHYIEYGVVRIIIAFFRILGIDGASWFSGKLLRTLGPLLRPLSKRGEDNLRMIFPDWSKEKINATIKDVWENLGRTGAEYAHLDKLKIDGERPRIICEGIDKILPIFDDPGRAIFVTGHFANWEVTGINAQQQGLKFGVVYRALNNPLLDEYIIKKRGRVTTRRQIPKGMAGARPLIDLLKDNYSIAVLADQKLNTGGIRVPFMGHDAMTAPAAARMAVRFNLPVIPISNERLDGAYFKVTVQEPIPFEPTGDLLADVEALTIKINEVIERDVRARPGQWLWMHRRWKITPQPTS